MVHTTLQYLRLKVIASVIRFFATWSLDVKADADEKIQIPSRNGKRKINVHIYKSSTERHPSPVLLNWSSSGFVIDMHGSDHEFCRRMAQETDFTVLDASYALAPEYPFPAALEDAEDLILYVLNRPDEYDVNNIALSGFSAGANLALAVASDPAGKARNGVIKSVLAFYPPCDLSIPPERKKAPDGSAGTIPAFVARTFNECYIGSEDPSNPAISISKADPRLFPPNVLIISAGKDNLAEEAEDLGHRIQEEEGKLVTMRRYSQDHFWDKTMWEEDTKAYRDKDRAYILAALVLITSDAG
ncbi:alpha/beta-hydrolase [Microthyrium microscopicum]|uniref:Alpha/beta-hydrolase n=1 Tax=Microthyrium microscopicum TaxID=703497 RepID=A0A6A6UPE7_9PEZI|nr:alpha/beta-hydrolase [Microthyrium microscopicum]